MQPTILLRNLILVAILWLFTEGMLAQTHKHFGFELPEQSLPCGITEDVYVRELQPKLQESYDMLISKGALAEEFLGPRSPGSLHWPLRMEPNFENKAGVHDVYTTTNYADLNPSSNFQEDWMCATGSSARNYDQHNGADLGLGRYSWKMQAEGNIEVIAAAAGQVLWIHDGAFDRNCGDLDDYIDTGTDPTKPAYGNHVALQHAGSVTIYAHLKNGTVANLQIGDQVKLGQYLGKVGSSGRSTGPHLHFEVRPAVYLSWIEPWRDGGANADCNNTVTSSWWANQKPYTDTKIIRVMTASANAQGVSCENVIENSSTENPLEVNHFVAFSPIQIRVIVRDRPALSQMNVRVYSPNNSLLETFSSSLLTIPQTIYGAGLWYWNYIAPTTVGTYRIEAELGSQKLNHYFTVGCPSSYNLSNVVVGDRGYLASSHINSTHVITGSASNQIRYEAGNYIQFNPGFVATQGSTLRTQINGCSLGSAITAQGQEEEMVKDVQINSFDVYPNPTRGQFTVSVEMEESVEEGLFILRNSLGQVVDTRQRSGYHTFVEYFDSQNLAPGIYLIEFQTGHTRKVQKLVVQ